ncbi:putative ribonuclease H-like domain-containing protein [Tanacetum coccineum]|uniref:Ribonuclease H-like domain-containing protein n=1 Tax=Tanacetum coccineum TaxID=301880 RepID=A0ABQ5C645_9ASTR
MQKRCGKLSNLDLVAMMNQRRCKRVSTKDPNQKFLRSLPSAWSQISLIMRTKPGVDSLSFDDMYNNLRVFEPDVKGSTASSSSTQNVAFVSENTSSTNEVSTAYGASSSSGHNPQREGSSSYTDELINRFKMELAMISMRLKKFYKKTGRKLQFDVKEPVGFYKAKVECYNCHKTGYFTRECRYKGNQDSRRRDARYTGYKAKDSGRRPGKQEEPKALVTLDGEGSDTEAKAEKEKEELKAKVEKWHNSSKNLNILLTSQMSARDKAGIGSSDIKDSPINDRYVEGMHAVPPPMTGIYISSRPDVEIDESQFTYGPKQSKPSESDARSSDFNSCESNSSEETLTSMPEPIVNEPKVVSQPKVWSDAPIIEEYELDSDDEHVSLPTKEQETHRYWKRENKPVWNNVQRVNHQNQFVPKAVLTRIGRILVNTARASSTNNVNTARHNFNSQTAPTNAARKVNTDKPIDVPHKALENKRIIDSGCSRHMTGNKTYLAKYQDYNGGRVAFGGSKGYITGKGKIKTRKLDFEDVCFVKELQHFNLFSVSQMCDKKNKVLFTDTECLVLSPDFKLPDENQVLLRVPRQNNMYSFNLENIVPSGGLACLIAKATVDESNKWHRRLGHVNFKNLNKLVKGNLVRGLPSKIFQNDHTCVACQKGKQHKASCKAKSVSSISQPLQLLHMDLFGPTSVRSLNHKIYCLVITDDFSRFSWVFFLRTKDETSGILKDFIRQIENQLNKKVKTIRCDNGTKFKNRDMIEFCGSKGIKMEYSNARSPQQNGVAERKNRTLIEATRTMLADSFLPNTF